jgi:hypothetical protein
MKTAGELDNRNRIQRIAAHGDPFSHLFVVTRKHHAADVHLLERGDRLLRLGPDNVGQRDSAL